MPKFFCDYCDVYLTHDSMSVRKAHNSGRNHLRNVVDYYQQIGHEKAQSVIDSITNSYAAEGVPGNNPMLQQQPGLGGAGFPGAGGPPGFGSGPPGGPPGGLSGFPPSMGAGGPGMPPPGMPPLPPGFMPPQGGAGRGMPPFPPSAFPGPPQGMPPGFPPAGGPAGSPPQNMPFPPPGGMPPNFPPPNFQGQPGRPNSGPGSQMSPPPGMNGAGRG